MVLAQHLVDILPQALDLKQQPRVRRPLREVEPEEARGDGPRQARRHDRQTAREQARRRSNSFSQALATEDSLGDPLGEEKREDRAQLSPRNEEQQPATAGEIPPAMQHMLWFSGLRGAVAFSCARVQLPPSVAKHSALP